MIWNVIMVDTYMVSTKSYHRLGEAMKIFVLFLSQYLSKLEGRKRNQAQNVASLLPL